MAGLLREIADAVAESLETVSWVVGSTSVSRKNWANIDPQEMSNPVVIVIPGNADVSRIGRGVWQTDYTVNVFVGRHVETDGEVDAMIDLADQAVEHLKAHQWSESISWPGGIKGPQSVQIEINPDDALTDRNVWRAAISIVYRVAATASV